MVLGTSSSSQLILYVMPPLYWGVIILYFSSDLVDVCEDAFTWMEANQENVIVVHCKGGKGKPTTNAMLVPQHPLPSTGRTGTMISSWLVRAGLFMGANESLAYFSDRRTDKSRGTKCQGVQTPSQSRYVIYYERLLTEMDGSLPPPISLRLRKLTLLGLYGNCNQFFVLYIQLDLQWSGV